MKNKTEDTKSTQITAKTDALMREIANLMWDRMFDDLNNGELKFKKEPTEVKNDDKKRVNSTNNTT